MNSDLHPRALPEAALRWLPHVLGAEEVLTADPIPGGSTLAVLGSSSVMARALNRPL